MIASGPGSQKVSAIFNSDYQPCLQANLHYRRCHLCTLLSIHIKKLLEDVNEEERLELVISQAGVDTAAAYISIFGEAIGIKGWRRYPGDISIGHSQCFPRHQLSSALNIPVDRVKVSTLSSSQTCSPEALERVRSWNKACLEHHTICQRPRTSNELPLRLLDVLPTISDRSQVTEIIQRQQYDELSLENIFQERYLAPRVIHFTKDQAYWGCNQLVASEVLPAGHPNSRTAKRMPFQNSSYLLSEQRTRTKHQWYDLLHEYSKTSLTFGNDRLLAISAIAKRYCTGVSFHPSEYLAGM